MNQTFTAIVRKEDHLYVAECSETGTASQGDSIKEALTNLIRPYDMEQGCKYAKYLPFWA
jgi:hypothetical protein